MKTLIGLEILSIALGSSIANFRIRSWRLAAVTTGLMLIGLALIS